MRLTLLSVFCLLGCGENVEQCKEARNPYAVAGTGSLSVEHDGVKEETFDIFVEVVGGDGVEIDACSTEAEAAVWRLATAWGGLEGAELPAELSLTDRMKPYFSGFLLICTGGSCDQPYAMHSDPAEPAEGTASVERYSLETRRLEGVAEIENQDATTTRLEVDVNW